MTTDTTDVQDYDYDPFKDNDQPRVQIPIGRDTPGLTIDGEFYPAMQLPDDAYEAFEQWINGGGYHSSIGLTEVHECDDCAERSEKHDVGYLTTSENIGSYKNPYTCSNKFQMESATVNGTTVGRFAPNPWNVKIEMDGESSAPVHDTTDPRDYTVTIRRRDSYSGNAETLGETVLTFTDVEVGFKDTVSGTTDGCEWAAEVSRSEGGLTFEWSRVRDGQPVEYAYRETEGMEHKNPNEILGLLPVDADTEADDVTVHSLSVTAKTRVRERECESTNFTKVWPPQRVVYDEDVVPVPELESEDVPNSASHLSRMQNNIDDEVGKEEMLARVSKACKEFWEEHGYPRGHDKHGR